MTSEHFTASPSEATLDITVSWSAAKAALGAPRKLVQVCSEAAEKLAELSWTMWRKFDPCTVDDITAMVVDLHVTAEAIA